MYGCMYVCMYVCKRVCEAHMFTNSSCIRQSFFVYLGRGDARVLCLAMYVFPMQHIEKLNSSLDKDSGED